MRPNNSTKIASAAYREKIDHWREEYREKRALSVNENEAQEHAQRAQERNEPDRISIRYIAATNDYRQDDG